MLFVAAIYPQHLGRFLNMASGGAQYGEASRIKLDSKVFSHKTGHYEHCAYHKENLYMAFLTSMIS